MNTIAIGDLTVNRLGFGAMYAALRSGARPPTARTRSRSYGAPTSSATISSTPPTATAPG